MTLYLENTSNKKTMSLRYGDGNNLLLQLNPGEKQPLPLKMNKQKLQVYLHLFKELRLVKDSNDKDDEKIVVDKHILFTYKNENDLDESDKDDSNENENDEDENESDEDDPSKDQLPLYSEKELNGFKAAVIKEIATKLGIEVTSDSTKKALIPVILNKQGK